MSSYNYGEEEQQAREQVLHVARPRRIEPTVYRESNIITAQPRPDAITTRLPIPSIQYGSFNSPTSPTPFIPRTGLDYLQGLASIHIQHTFELNENHSTVSSENRFTIRTAGNEAVFAASESSNPKSRLILGSSRPFSMHILDRTHQEALTLYRRIACKYLCCSFQPQFIEVWIPPGDFVGFVRVGMSWGNEVYVEDATGDKLFEIQGPNYLSCCFPEEAHFRVMSADLLTQKGTISRNWNRDVSAHTLSIYFANSELDVRHKALLLAAGFMLEYKFFQRRANCC